MDIRQRVAGQLERIQALADALASLDVYRSFAVIAVEKKYVRPILKKTPVLDLVEGRHPVIESLLVDEPFIPNDCQLKDDKDLLAIITGPNMAGKSTYIRMVAILAIMAQAGSYVPAKSMTLGIVDRIFARVGASDDLARGDSTFMVEMKEVAYILRHATPHSLIILDEVGRGTSTIDGLSIAWAISEYMLDQIKARTLFATHYHELIALEGIYQGVVNLSMAVKEEKDRVVFLRTVVRQGTDQSYGIHVAMMAGLPPSVIARASQKLSELGQSELQPLIRQGKQMAFIEDHPVLRMLEQIDPENVSPKQALDLLYLLKEKGRGDE